MTATLDRPATSRVPQDLVAFAAARTGEYLIRYREILGEAFGRHTLLLNAKQLRELAGGGSQTTAQRAIDEFRADLGAKLSHRIRLGAEVPAAVAEAATSMLESLWALARDGASEQFEGDRAELRAQADQARQRAEELTLAREQLNQELSAAGQQLVQRQGEIDRLGGALTQVQVDLLRERQESADDRARLGAQIQELQRSTESLRHQLEQARGQRDQLQEALQTEQRESARRFDRMLIEHREALGAVKREMESKLAAQSREAKAQQDKLEVRLEAAMARSAQQEAAAAAGAAEVQRLERLTDDLKTHVGELQAQVQQARQEAQQAQERLIEHLSRKQPSPGRSAAKDPGRT